MYPYHRHIKTYGDTNETSQFDGVVHGSAVLIAEVLTAKCDLIQTSVAAARWQKLTGHDGQPIDS